MAKAEILIVESMLDKKVPKPPFTKKRLTNPMKRLSETFVEGLLNATPLSLIDVWTIQDRENWPLMYDVASCSYFGEWHHKDSFSHDDDGDQDSDTIKAYEYMNTQLHERIENFSGDAPVWVWPFKPNIRSYMRGMWAIKEYNSKKNREKPDFVLVRARVPRKRILFSCYDLWHCCLNNWPITEQELEDDDPLYNDPASTWHLIFDINTKNKALKVNYGADRRVQGCVDRIGLNEIVSCDRIVGRKLFPLKGQ
jgi:hypothetical protein